MRSLALSCGFGVLLALAGCGSDADSGLFDITSPPLAGSSGAGPGGTSASTGGKGGSSAGAGGAAAGKGGASSEAGGAGPAGSGGDAGGDEQGGQGGDEQGGQGGAGEGGASGQGGALTTGGAGGQSAGGTSAGTGGGSGGAQPEGGAAGTGASGQGGSGFSGQSGAGQAGAGQAGAGPAGAGGAGQSGAAGAGGGTTSQLDTCPGEPVTLVAGQVTLTGDTSSLKNDTSSGTNQCGGSNSNDAVYAMTASAAGRVTLVLNGSGFNPTVYVRKACTEPGNALCDAGQTSAQVTFLVNKGATFAAFVDGYGTGNQAGPYTLTATLDPSVCGDGDLEIGEQCDDGNTASGDGCDATCQLEPGCKVNDGKDTSFSSPGVLPAGCATVDVSNVKITSDNGTSDNDWYCADVAAGQTLSAQTYTGSPGLCSVDPNNTFVEIYRNKPSQAPGNNTCQNNGAVACNDDIGQNNGFQATCSLATYKVPEGQGGTYCIRVTRGAIPESGSTIVYGLTVTIE